MEILVELSNKVMGIQVQLAALVAFLFGAALVFFLKK